MIVLISRDLKKRLISCLIKTQKYKSNIEDCVSTKSQNDEAAIISQFWSEEAETRDVKRITNLQT